MQTPLAIYYVSADDQTELWKIVIATGVNSQVDVDPDNSSGDVKSRDHKIQALWYDYATGYIWGVDCDNDGTADNFDVWKLAIVDDTCTDIGTSSGADANTVYVLDILVYSGNTYVVNIEYRLTVKYMVSWDVDTAPFTEKDTMEIDVY